MLYPLELQRQTQKTLPWWELNPQPLVPEVTRAFTTPRILAGSYFPEACLLCPRPRTLVAPAGEIASVHQLANRQIPIRRKPASTGAGRSNPGLILLHLHPTVASPSQES